MLWMWPGYLRGEFPPTSRDGAGPETNGKLAARKGRALDSPRLVLQLEIQGVKDLHIFTWIAARPLAAAGSSPAICWTRPDSGSLTRTVCLFRENTQGSKAPDGGRRV